MRAALIAVMLMIGSQAGAECGNLCDYRWWKTATKADVQAELDGGADVSERSDRGFTPLHTASAESNAENVALLLSAGAEIMARTALGTTPLALASGYGPVEKVQLLLKAGAEVHSRNSDGFTPLHSATLSRNNTSDIILELLNAGAEVKIKNKYGKTPWDYAQRNATLKGTKGYWALNDAQYK